jgi:hypothetical protein
MNYNEKFSAILALMPHSCLKMRRFDKSWYIARDNIEISREGMLESPTVSCATPEIAVNEMWEIYTNLKPPSHLVINAMLPNREEYLWNGFMWEKQIVIK